jgi:hypothetical protein
VNLLKDPDSFRNTMNDALNTSMACLRLHTACAAGAQQIVNVRDAGNNIIFGNLPAWNAANYNSGGGFNESGNICNTFSDQVANANDLCPFTYKIVWEPLAAGVDPGFRISARLRYSPANNSTSRLPVSMGKMTGNPATDLFPITSTIDPTKEAVQVVGNSNSQYQDLNMGKYDVALWRTGTTSIKGFRISTTSSGTCNTASSFAPPTTLRGGFVEDYDPFNIIEIAGSDQLNFKYAGTFECDMTAAGNGVLGFQIRLCSGPGACNSNIYGSGAGFANYSAGPPVAVTQSWIEVNTVFTLSAPTTLTMRQICQQTLSIQDLGLNSPPGTTTATLNCRMVE